MRLGIISDIHANRLALEACLEVMDGEPLDEIICLGDVVGYGPDPQSCVEIVREREFPCLLGNHDIAAATGEGIEQFNPIAEEAALWTRGQLDKASLAWLTELPRELHRDDVLFAHGAPGDTDHYVLTSGDVAEVLERTTERFIVCGHTHQPLVHLIDRGRPFRAHDFSETTEVELPADGRAFLNPGSVGQPRDGVPHAAFGILDLEESLFTVVRVPYPAELVASQIMNAGLPEMLGARLLIGH